MPDPLRSLIEPLIHRDLESISESVSAASSSAGLEETAAALLRFAVLAHENSIHSRNAWLSTLSIHELTENGLAETDHLTAAATYLAESRVPWGEAPVADVPEARTATIDEVEDAIEAGDRERLEGWIASLCAERDFDVIGEMGVRHPGSEGWAMISASAALRTLSSFPKEACYPVLCLPLSEWILDDEELEEELNDGIEAFRKEPGVASLHRLQLLDARRRLTSRVDAPPVVSFEPYRLAEDFGARAQLCTIGSSLGLDEQSVSDLQKIAREAAERGETWEEWSFA